MVPAVTHQLQLSKQTCDDLLRSNAEVAELTRASCERAWAMERDELRLRVASVDERLSASEQEREAQLERCASLEARVNLLVRQLDEALDEATTAQDAETRSSWPTAKCPTTTGTIDVQHALRMANAELQTALTRPARRARHVGGSRGARTPRGGHGYPRPFGGELERRSRRAEGEGRRGARGDGGALCADARRGGRAADATDRHQARVGRTRPRPRGPPTRTRARSPSSTRRSADAARSARRRKIACWTSTNITSTTCARATSACASSTHKHQGAHRHDSGNPSLRDNERLRESVTTLKRKVTELEPNEREWERLRQTQQEESLKLARFETETHTQHAARSHLGRARTAAAAKHPNGRAAGGPTGGEAIGRRAQVDRAASGEVVARGAGRREATGAAPPSHRRAMRFAAFVVGENTRESRVRVRVARPATLAFLCTPPGKYAAVEKK